jgi:SAM-dependent methyltransferase
VRYSPDWLGLREAADGRARARELAVLLADGIGAVPSTDEGSPDQASTLIVHDLGCGTGSMSRWLAPLLPGPQHWVLHDQDPELLALAAARMPARAGDGSPVTAQTRTGDLTALTAADLAGVSLVTGSALLDLLTAEEIDRLARLCAGNGCAVLFALSVLGRVELTPEHPLDAAVSGAFNAHQRREVGGRRLLGPDAVALARDAFTRCGAQVEVRSSPWRLGPAEAALTGQWLRGWVAAAGEQRPDLDVEDYLASRLAEAGAGRLAVVVHHGDVLARFERTLFRPAPYLSVTTGR